MITADPDTRTTDQRIASGFNRLHLTVGEPVVALVTAFDISLARGDE